MIHTWGHFVQNVGVGRYDVDKHEKFRSRNGNKSSFSSKVPILLEPSEDKIIKLEMNNPFKWILALVLLLFKGEIEAACAKCP